MSLRFAFLLLLGLTLAPSLIGCGGSTLPPVRSEVERIELAKRLAAKGDLHSATDVLKSFIVANTGSAHVDEAIYLLGICYLSSKDFVAAGAEFERLLRDYPESDSGPSASYQLGEALFGQARPEAFDQEFTFKALDQWQRYLTANPGHWLNAKAEQRIVMTRRRVASKMLNTAKLYLKLRLYEPARIYYERIEREYGDTGLLGEALLGQATIAYRTGRRDEAVQRLKAIELQFKGESIARRAEHERKRID